MDLIAFVEARLAEDEAWALAASQPYEYAAEGATVPPGGVHWTWVVDEDWTPITPDPAVDDKVGGPEHYGCSVNLASVEQWPNQGSDHGWPVHMMRRTIATEMVEVDSSAAGHIARHDPARVLREVEAKRNILVRHVTYATRVERNGDLDLLDLPERLACDGCGWDDGRPRTPALGECPELRALASVFADHPDYDPTWSPS